MTPSRQIALWLFAVSAAVVLVMLVGGLTRLSNAGLSITEWKPITGLIPPLSETAWRLAFEKYQTIPEYQFINRDMDLSAFKVIYWWEWAHRFLARLIGVVFIAPLLVFALQRKIVRRLWLSLLGLLIFGGLQGFIGWYMVQSGLSDRVDVSQYRLALHLGLALIIFGWSLWLGFDLWGGRVRIMTRPFLPRVIVAIIFVQCLLGALVAGLDAGRIYNEWPRIDGAFIPEGMFHITPWIKNIFENHLTVQFNHRLLSYVLALLVLVALIRKTRARLVFLGVLICLQMGLGIITLLFFAPLSLAIAHQMGAVILLGFALYDAHQSTPMRA